MYIEVCFYCYFISGAVLVAPIDAGFVPFRRVSKFDFVFAFIKIKYVAPATL